MDIGFSDDTGDVMAFADLDSDKFTDIITVPQGSNNLELHLFDPFYKKFIHANTIEVSGCGSIHNIVVGRSVQYLRLFVTCSGGAGTIVRFIDRIGVGKEAGIEDFSWNINSNIITIETDTQPFIADINGDFLEDVVFNQPGQSDIMVAFQVAQDPTLLHVVSFNEAITGVEYSEPGCLSPLGSKSLTTPHATAMIDFDGDCMADLFVTVSSGGRNYYEIYLRRERSESIDLSEVNGYKSSAP